MWPLIEENEAIGKENETCGPWLYFSTRDTVLTIIGTSTRRRKRLELVLSNLTHRRKPRRHHPRIERRRLPLVNPVSTVGMTHGRDHRGQRQISPARTNVRGHVVPGKLQFIAEYLDTRDQRVSVRDHVVEVDAVSGGFVPKLGFELPEALDAGDGACWVEGHLFERMKICRFKAGRIRSNVLKRPKRGDPVGECGFKGRFPCCVVL